MKGSAGYAIIRAGILEHLCRGDLGFPELGIYIAIHLQADFRSGVWWGSAPKLLAAAPRGTTLRDVQRWMETLRRIGFLRPFNVRGKKGNYAVLIDKYNVRTGALKGSRLNAWKSESWRSPCYESCADNDADDGTDAAPSSVSSNQEAREPAAFDLSQDSVWKFLKIEPCGPASFRALLENGWNSRNGGSPSALIGNTIDAWETAEGQRLRRCASLFRALAKIRERENRPSVRREKRVEAAPKNELSAEAARRLKEYGVAN
jgi:hypothetical protein